MQNTKPHLYEKWGNDNQSMATFWLRVIFMGFFLYNSIRLQQNEMQYKIRSELFAGESMAGKRKGCPKVGFVLGVYKTKPLGIYLTRGYCGGW
jgi:hypothetical protein